MIDHESCRSNSGNGGVGPSAYWVMSDPEYPNAIETASRVMDEHQLQLMAMTGMSKLLAPPDVWEKLNLMQDNFDSVSAVIRAEISTTRTAKESNPTPMNPDQGLALMRGMREWHRQELLKARAIAESHPNSQLPNKRKNLTAEQSQAKVLSVVFEHLYSSRNDECAAPLKQVDIAKRADLSGGQAQRAIRKLFGGMSGYKALYATDRGQAVMIVLERHRQLHEVWDRPIHPTDQ